MSDTITKACSKKYLPAYRQSGTRSARDVTLGVIHCTEASTAVSSARYFQNHDAGGSAHLIVDDNECYRCLDDLVIPWGAPPCNSEGYHIEMAGYSEWSEQQWLSHTKTIERAAYKMALRCKRFKIPAKWLSVNELKLGHLHGITSHNNISLAFHKSDHTDPGPHFPQGLFMQQLTKYLAALKAK